MTANLRLSSFLPSALKLEGYLTGVIVSPGLIKPSLWFASLFDGDDRIFDNEDEVKEVLGAVMIRYNLLCNDIDRSLKRFEDRRICDYRPAFLTTSDQPTHSAVREWVGGFWKAMALAPAGWSALAEDERTQLIIGPFVGFINTDDDGVFEATQDFESRLDEIISDIPRAILLLHKIAKLRSVKVNKALTPARLAKVGRNDPCPCGSGKKYKHCCVPSRT